MTLKNELRAEELAKPETAARSLNAVLRDVYAVVNKISRRAFIELSFKTPAVNAYSIFPMVVPNPGFAVKGLNPVYLWNVTANAPEPFGSAGGFQWRPTSNGKLSIEFMLVSEGCQYNLRLEAMG